MDISNTSGNSRPQFYVGDSKSFTKCASMGKVQHASSSCFCAVATDSDASSTSKDSYTSLIRHCSSHHQCRNDSYTPLSIPDSRRSIFDKYYKLRKLFYILCVFNVFLVLVAGSTMGYLLYRTVGTEDRLRDILSTKDNKEVESTLPDSEKQTATHQNTHHLNCTIIKNRRDSSIKLIGNCSLEDLANKAEKILRKNEYVIHLINGVPDSKSTNGDHQIINWQKDTYQSVRYSDRTHSIIAPVTGYYFVYNRMVFSWKPHSSRAHGSRDITDVEIKHSFQRKQLGYPSSVLIHSSSLNCSNNAFVHSSYLQRTIHLTAGDEIRVVVSFSGRAQLDTNPKYIKENNFGMFKI
ncbi:hypothetical protein FSP39_018236 [Pinctada imbricata]|uniref:THD domain-containing protein n=1 Tax=Pinctada imbricata TaxID=66713 RepID=A0AA89C5Q0_PINIB|nr:hypothetical protein FSP39_018236 [Pinctada imbricata]